MYRPNFPSVPFRLGLYPVVDSVMWIERLLDIGVRTIQIRIKDKQDKDVEANLVKALEIGNQYHARLFINDYWELAIRHHAWGVHLGQEDLETTNLHDIRKAGLRIGISTHNAVEVDKALAVRPSYISLGHIFPTKTKQMRSMPQGIKQLTEHVVRLEDYPTVAIGGINLSNIHSVISTGVGSIGIVSAITQVDNWRKVTIDLLNIVGSGDDE